MRFSKTPGPIGVFDSGYGGLTILKQIRTALPQYDYVYLGDNARTPYGTRSFEIVYQFTLQAVTKLFEMGCHLVILGCNTASAKALRSIQMNNLPLLDPNRRVLGVIRPTVEVIGNLTRSRHVGLLATPGTVRSESYPMEIKKLFPDVEVHSQACPMWVPLVEYGEATQPGADYFVQKYIDQLLSEHPQIDTLILGCTHYPMLLDKIRKYTPQGVRIVTQGELEGASLADYLARHPEMAARCTQGGTCRYFTTESVQKFTDNASIFLNEHIDVSHVELSDNASEESCAQASGMAADTTQPADESAVGTTVVFKGSQWECQLVKGLLESCGIDAMTMPGQMDACTASGFWDDTAVLVKEPDAQTALHIIDERKTDDSTI